MNAARVVLLSCGSFNPITNMHLRMFEIAKDYLHKTGQYQVIGGIISPVNDGYKKQGLVSSKHRNNMVALSLKTSDWIRLDTWETEQDAWVETCCVLQHHENVLNPKKDVHLSHSNESDNENQVQLKMLCGADLLESFQTPGLWKDEHIEELVSRFGLVVISRGGSNPEKFIYESDILYRNSHNIHIVTEWITNEISSTKIRRALHRCDSVKYLIQDSVLDYIKANGLYGVEIA